MENFNVIYGNRLELLAEHAARLIRENPLDSPFATEYLVVQTPGMERWLSLELARMAGIFGGFKFLTPDGLGRLLEEKTGRGRPGASPFDRHNFTWAVARLLEGNLLDEPEYAPLKRYVGNSELKRFQIASRIADLFDQYAVYRPDLLEGWERGELSFSDLPAEIWQQKLWVRLLETFGKKFENRHERMKNLREEIKGTLPGSITGFPQRVIAFGISVLPPVYLDLLRGCARHSDLYLFAMNPSREFWEDLTPDRIRVRKERQMGLSDPADAHIDRGNRLLASMGKAGMDFYSLLFDGEVEDRGIFAEPGDATLLQKIQSDILNLNDRGHEESEAKEFEKEEIDAGDTSLQIASCHSPLREVEALQDYLLSQFDEDPSLEPRDVLVLTPDINAYAPYIEGVFGVAHENERMPFSIADRTISNESRIADAFLSILDLVGARLELSRVFSILDAEPVRRRFNLELSDLEMLRDTTRGAGIRWGRDGAFRESLGLPGTDENTWMRGLHRLILGYAADGANEDIFMDILPFGAPEGEKAAVLGNFLSFCEELFSLLDSCRESMHLVEWHGTFSRVLETFFVENSDTEQELRYILGQINRLPEMEQLTGYRGMVSFEVMKSYFTERFNTDMTGRGFITGGITFCSMVPLRSIPFRIIALLGMNDGAFPRRFRSPGFDLIAHRSRRGDRNIRESDRYLFLETILSCRESLYISYVGRSIRDNTILIPSNLVTELISYIEDSFVVEGSEDTGDWLITEHPLQAFSRRYFAGDAGRLFSYRKESCSVAASIAAGGRKLPGSFAGADIPLTENEIPETLTGNDIVSFLSNPSKHFMQGRLSISIEEFFDEGEDTESFSLDNLERYKLQADLLERSLRGEDTGATGEIYRAGGILPHGTPGTMLWESLRESMETFAARINSEVGTAPEETWNCRLDIDGTTVIGRGGGLRRGRLVMYRPARLKARDRLRLWTAHLLCNASGVARESCFIATDTMLLLAPPEDSKKLLKDLLALYRRGLEKPLPFFPQSSWAYIDKLLARDDEEKAMKEANGKFLDNFKFTGEKNNDTWFSTCFSGFDLYGLEKEFRSLSKRVYEPLIEVSREEAINE